MTNHRALVTALASVGDHQAAAAARAAHLLDVADRAWAQWLTATELNRDQRQKDYAAAQNDLTLWLVAVDKDAQAEVEALVKRWARESAADVGGAA